MGAPRKRSSLSNLWQIPAWVTGGLSLLNLLEDLSPLTLYDKIGEWTNAYSTFVERVAGWLFGWLDFGWVSMDSREAHLFVVTLIVFSAYFRADLRDAPKAPSLDAAERFGESIGVTLVMVFVILLPSIILPLWTGIVGSAIAFLLMLIAILFGASDDFQPAPPSSFFRELIAVTGVCFVLIAVNYALFS